VQREAEREVQKEVEKEVVKEVETEKQWLKGKGVGHENAGRREVDHQEKGGEAEVKIERGAADPDLERKGGTETGKMLKSKLRRLMMDIQEVEIYRLMVTWIMAVTRKLHPNYPRESHKRSLIILLLKK